MDIFKIIGFSILGVIAINVLRKIKDEYAFFVSVFLCMTLTVSALGFLVPVINYLNTLEANIGDYGIFTIMFKACGIAVVTTLAASLCRDCGESALASRVELCGKSIVLAMSLPLLKQVLDNAISIIS